MLRKKLGIEVVLRNMPDPMVARERIWIPFIENEIGVDENTIVVGHSSGAVAAMRLCEKNQLYGAILVSACYTDLGCDNEKASGYYSREWQWEKIMMNTGFIVQFHSDNDPFIPLEGILCAHAPTSLNTSIIFLKSNFGNENRITVRGNMS